MGALGGSPLIVKGIDAFGTFVGAALGQTDKVDERGTQAINTAGNWSAASVGQLNKLSAKLNETASATTEPAAPAAAGDPDQ